MSDELFTPSTAQVRSHYVFNQSDQWDAERGVQFDRWLAAHDSDLTTRLAASGADNATLLSYLENAEAVIAQAMAVFSNPRQLKEFKGMDVRRILSAYRPVVEPSRD